MVAIGILCIFMVEYNPNLNWNNSFLTAKTNYSKQIYFALFCAVIAIFILLMDSKVFTAFANILTGASKALFSIRVAPSVDNGGAAGFGQRDIMNRMQLVLRALDITTKTASAVTLASGLVSNLEIKLADHERVVFTDKAIAYDAAGRAGDVYALLAAALGTADVTKAYTGIGIHLADAGWTNKELATALLATDTYKADAGGVSDETFIKHVYKNVYGTNASLADVTALTTWMTTNKYSQADVLVAASELAAFETTIGLVGLATTGIEYTPFVA